MKWIAILAATGIAIYLFTTKKGKRIRSGVTELAREAGELKDYLGNIASDVKQKGLQYGEQPEPVASRQRYN